MVTMFDGGTVLKIALATATVGMIFGSWLGYKVAKLIQRHK